MNEPDTDDSSNNSRLTHQQKEGQSVPRNFQDVRRGRRILKRISEENVNKEVTQRVAETYGRMERRNRDEPR